MTSTAATTAGYTVVLDRVSMQAIDTATETMVSGQFSTELPYEYDQSYAQRHHCPGALLGGADLSGIGGMGALCSTKICLTRSRRS
ncbi:MAG: hypothetical protein U9N87_14510 [Planctomycetota bacterium]|nr:hypothetical protein [Planctomycetota bacterium]